MRKIFYGIIIGVLIVFVLRYCEHQKDNREQLEAGTALIQKELNNVGKLVVTEGSYAQVFTYEDSKNLYAGLINVSKKALVIVNAEASISYDLGLIETHIDEEARTVTITKIPQPELKIDPNIEYYDIQQDYLHQFSAADYNLIKDRIEASLRKKIEASQLVSNAENRLISELQKLYIVTSAMGWTLKYGEQPIRDADDFGNFRQLPD